MSTTTLRPLPLALAFAARLRAAMTAECVATIVARNTTPEYASACASHDFLDANMLMSEAISDVSGRDPFSPIDLEDESVLSTWNKAWDWARAGQFNDSKIEDVADDQVLEEATEAALNEACLMIQKHLGVTTGDFAGMYFSGPSRNEIKSSLQLYLCAQRLDEQDT